MKWISMKDRLPENGNDYITYNPELGLAFTIFHCGRWAQFSGENITHWMEKPDIPKVPADCSEDCKTDYECGKCEKYKNISGYISAVVMEEAPVHNIDGEVPCLHCSDPWILHTNESGQIIGTHVCKDPENIMKINESKNKG